MVPLQDSPKSSSKSLAVYLLLCIVIKNQVFGSLSASENRAANYATVSCISAEKSTVIPPTNCKRSVNLNENDHEEYATYHESHEIGTSAYYRMVHGRVSIWRYVLSIFATKGVLRSSDDIELCRTT